MYIGFIYEISLKNALTDRKERGTKQNTSRRFFNRLLKGLCIVSAVCISGLSVAVDTDNDGLPDDWEIANGRDPLVADYMVSVGRGHTCALDDSGVV
jgi:hypothetical protein